MPNVFDANGLSVSTRPELIAFYTARFQAIYGADVNLESNSPDGQMMNEFVQSVIDLQDLLVQINSAFDPDNAVGVTLDQRVAINGIRRQGGTYTVTPITLVNDRSVTLQGIDLFPNDPYTIADNSGTQWVLETTQSGLAAGTHVLNFRAASPGQTLTVPNTINVQVTVVLGIVSVNNPTTYTSLGVNEEADAILKIRRQKSVFKASQGYLLGLLAALADINGVTSAFVYENKADLPDGDGVPGHSIWVIVAGSGAASAIASAIYGKRNAGCGLFGDTTYTVALPDGSPFIVQWDDAVEEDLFIKFTVTSLNGTVPPNITAIRTGLVTALTPGVNAEVNINQLATLVQQIDPNTLVTLAGFSLTTSGFTNTLTPSTKKDQFRVTAPKVIIIPMQLTPPTSSVVTTTQIQMAGLGGYGTLVYSFSVNASGGTINSSTGLYTAGSTPGTDTLRVDDALSNFATATVTVT